ncbi:MAG: RNA polymerase sigma factor [Solirubrobacteraceae bacterium]|jgi:RNA polymerase sigma-70 factor (ECF subfamily)
MSSARDQAVDGALLAGGPQEFGAFYLRQEAGVLGFFLRRVGKAELAADLCAETFARALESRRSFDPARGEPRAWLFGIARHVLAESLERGRVLSETRVRLAFEPLVLDDEDIARLEELAEQPAVAALERLPSEQRDAIAGRVIDERPYDELAASLRCSNSLVRQRVSRGLRALRERLEGAS